MSDGESMLPFGVALARAVTQGEYVCVRKTSVAGVEKPLTKKAISAWYLKGLYGKPCTE